MLVPTGVYRARAVEAELSSDHEAVARMEALRHRLQAAR